MQPRGATLVRLTRTSPNVAAVLNVTPNHLYQFTWEEYVCLKRKIPVIWVNRHGEQLEPGQKKPTEEVKTFREAGKLLGAA